MICMAEPNSFVLCGVDLVEYSTFRRCVEMGGDRFLERYYTEAERDYCQERISCLGARFAMKEAVAKALGTGFRGVRPVEIETRRSPQGKPLLQLHGHAAIVAEQIGISHWEVSLSHDPSYAIAIVIAMRQEYTTGQISGTIMAAMQGALQQEREVSLVLDETAEEITKSFADER